MKKALAAAAIVATVLAPASVYAVSNTTQQTTTEKDVATTMAPERVASMREAAKAKALQAKTEAQQRRLALTQQRCEAMKDRLTTTVPKLAQGITSVKSTLDKNYERIQAVHDKGTLNTPDYDTLDTAVQQAKAAAEGSIAAIDPSSVTVNCATNGLGAQLDGYRSTIKEARTSLKAYHTALVKLISAMNASSEKTTATQETTTNESN